MKKVTISEAELPAYLKRLRGTRTQAEFGAYLGVSKQAVTQYENGSTPPKPSTLAKLGITKVYQITK
jgi:transcriptional regulator with XRE-family HTH domain